MRITELLPVRNEEWCIGFSLRAHLMWADDAIVLNHASTDNTRGILEEIQDEVGKDRLTIIDHMDPVWRDTTQRQLLLEAGRRAGGELFSIFDADEVLTGNLLPDIRGIFETLKPAQCVTLPWIPMWKSIFKYRTAHITNGATSAFRDGPLLHWRADKGYDQHRRHPYESAIVPQPKVWGGGMHFQFTDWRRVVAKHALYKMNELCRWPGRSNADAINRQYDATLDESKIETAPTPMEWFWPYREIVDKMRLDIVPWQEAACRELWKKHGPSVFAGLNLYGLLGEKAVPVKAPVPARLAPAPRPVAVAASAGGGSSMQAAPPKPVQRPMTATEEAEYAQILQFGGAM
jgi:hypothetical protein